MSAPTLPRFEFRGVWFAIGRSVIALGQATVIALTPPAYLFAKIAQPHGVPCSLLSQKVSLYCLVPSHLVASNLLRYSVLFALLLVASGYRPRITGPLHLWLSVSIGLGIGLPDGGETIARIVTLLLLPWCLLDGRRWHWQKPSESLTPWAAGFALAFAWGLRIELAFIYLDSAISKLSVNAWASGTAEYYITRGTLFGAAGPLGNVFRDITGTAIGTLSLTWGALILEVIIGVLLVTVRRRGEPLFFLDVALHGMIILSMGLWSFALIMIGFAAAAATPVSPEGSSRRTRENEVEGLIKGLPSLEDPTGRSGALT